MSFNSESMPNIYVTQPTLPSLDELIPYLEKIWKNKILTNGGPFHQELEEALCDYLGVKYISLFTNATIALLVALKALDIKDEVITTPYSFVATSHSLLWNNLEPVFVDVDSNTVNLDPVKIEAAITPRTTAIMPVHCYGYPCNVSAIQKIADKYNLKVIYDAAHAFAVKDTGGSILRYGDLSILSFHATKVFNTFEGGAIICHDPALKKHIDQLKNFGFVDETSVSVQGINGKMSEFNASLGIVQLKHIDQAISKREKIDYQYRNALDDIRGIRFLSKPSGIVSNYGYFPIFIEKNYPLSRDNLYEKLKSHGIYARRYFYPLISAFSMYSDLPSASEDNLPEATKLSNKIICLPIYPDLDISIVNKIACLIKEV